MSNRAFYNRSYHLTITDEITGKSRTYTDLDIKFRIKRLVAPCKFEAHISILGLSSQTINEITATAILDVTRARQLKKRIVLSAGYEGSENQLFSGYIVHAVCDPPPDMWLNITADNYAEDIQDFYNISIIKEVGLKELFGSVAREIGLTPVFRYSGTNKRISGFVVVGNRQNVILNLEELARWYVFVDGDFLYCVDKEPSETTVRINIDRANGLIRIESVDCIGVAFRTWIRDDVPLANLVNLTSELIPSASGVYNIYEKEFRGHFRGDEWFTVYRGRRISR